ncbi:MAG: UDP-3-O-(3-hydroxymyristoyl)glucosamine N-acyltransferase [Blastocatellia bacterium]
MILREIADKLGCTIEGDELLNISGIATLEDAKEGEISFFVNQKYFNKAKITKASAIITGVDTPPLSNTLLRHQNPYLAFAKAIEIFHAAEANKPLIHPTAWIADSAKLGQKVSIGAYAYIGENVIIEDLVDIRARCTIHPQSIIGEKTLVHSGCVIRERVSIGKRCIIQDNAVIGSDGFGYAMQDDGSWYKILQSGTVVIEDDVEVGACTTIDRATLGETRIARGTKIDNLVQIGHGSLIGSDTLLCAQVGLAGSTKVGRQVILAGQVGVAGHLTIGDGVRATAQSGIANSIAAGEFVSGSPSVSHKDWLKGSAAFARLPLIQKTVREIEQRLNKLEKLYEVSQ